jgi:hypothetical protein
MLGTYGNMYASDKNAQAAAQQGLYGGLGAIGGGVSGMIAKKLLF